MTVDLEWLWGSDILCSWTSCPGLYRVDGGYVVQGKALDEATRARLRALGEDETAVFVPADLLDRLAGLSG